MPAKLNALRLQTAACPLVRQLLALHRGAGEGVLLKARPFKASRLEQRSGTTHNGLNEWKRPHSTKNLDRQRATVHSAADRSR